MSAMSRSAADLYRQEREEALAETRALKEALAVHRDLVSRLGFGDGITEPMADNDTIVAWFEEQGRDAADWRESQLWRNDCYAAGHPDDEDCYEHDPALRLQRAEHVVARVHALFNGGPDTPCRTTWPGGVECVEVPMADLRFALDGPP